MVCNTQGQKGDRKVIVEVEYASDEGMGSIVIKDLANDQEICRRETDKREAYQKIEIDTDK